MPNVFRLNQASDLPITVKTGKRISYRYGYLRSADSAGADENGQDYIAFIEDDARISFALCDGVSQSFFGDLAAKYLGNSLVDWFWALRSAFPSHVRLNTDLRQHLQQITDESSRLVAEYVLPENLAAMHRYVLEKKRGMGSETTFVAGYIHTGLKRIFLCWMGDSRLRLWDAKGELTEEILGKDAFLTRERWSTCQGAIGELHTVEFCYTDDIRLIAYSDGGARLDERISQGTPSSRTLDKVIQESRLLPSSDDVSLLEIWIQNKPQLEKTPPAMPQEVKADVDLDAGLLRMQWKPVQNASGYEVASQTGQGMVLFKTLEPFFQIPLNRIPASCQTLAVRAWQDAEASEWSAVKPPLSLFEKPEPFTLITEEKQVEVTPIVQNTFNKPLISPHHRRIPLILNGRPTGWMILFSALILIIFGLISVWLSWLIAAHLDAGAVPMPEITETIVSTTP